MQDDGFPTMSADTSGSSLYSSTPRVFGDSDAALYAALISSTDASRVRLATRSVIERVGVGTRSAMPSSRPLRSGSTRPMARAAPVVFGMIDNAAARMRRRSGL